jgi:hypothetical protein
MAPRAPSQPSSIQAEGGECGDAASVAVVALLALPPPERSRRRGDRAPPLHLAGASSIHGSPTVVAEGGEVDEEVGCDGERGGPWRRRSKGLGGGESGAATEEEVCHGGGGVPRFGIPATTAAPVIRPSPSAGTRVRPRVLAMAPPSAGGARPGEGAGRGGPAAAAPSGMMCRGGDAWGDVQGRPTRTAERPQ